ncbi:hypothetical protein BCIN_10g00320 [Botrytis cinerea B05.10]|uniref:Uncharacterized protein n=2 Tax=Botryotinia fuckeliana TaxID=40559 RepID=A0A384JTU2_BOTFB|nr:hypothetical protein BCIN_10g00320 [Botrytis cinerea B05.10]ATZ54006.1 hypothetical protein BCIN_10g00320 [Botrytis cinerea B05.10]
MITTYTHTYRIYHLTYYQFQISPTMATPSNPTETTAAPEHPLPRIIIRSPKEMERIRRLRKNLANSHPSVKTYAHDARCGEPSGAPAKMKRDSTNLGMKLGKTLHHREYLIKELGVFGMVANSEKRKLLYKNWVRITKVALQKEEESVFKEYRRLASNLMLRRKSICAKLGTSPMDRKALEKMLVEIKDKQREAVTACVKEREKVHMHRVKMENKMKEIKELLAEMSEFPQGDLAKIWGEGYDQAFKGIGRKRTWEESQLGEISELV